MSNKYLEKIAKFGVMNSIVKPAFGAIGDAGKAIGNNLHTAMGGRLRDLAATNGVTNPATLAKIDGSTAGLRHLIRNTPKGTVTKDVLKNLQHQRNTAIIKTVATAGGVGYIGKKIHEGLPSSQPQYDQQYY
jgi:hypothetical protein